MPNSTKFEAFIRIAALKYTSDLVDYLPSMLQLYKQLSAQPLAPSRK